MSIVTVRPNATISNGGDTGLFGGSTREGNASDDSDPTFIYVREYAGGAPSTLYASPLVMGFANPSPPANSQIKAVRLRARATNNVGQPGRAIMSSVLADTASPSDPAVATGFTTTYTAAYPTDFAGPWVTTAQDGAPWTAARLNGLMARIWLSDTSPDDATIYLYELYLDIDYNTAPTTAISVPTGTVPISDPTATWSYSDAEGDTHTQSTVKVFSAAQYGIAGFDPSTSPATQTFVVEGSSLYQKLGPLTNGTWRVYVKVSQGYVNGSPLESTWAYSQFVVNLLPIAPPMLALGSTPDAINITVLGGQNILSLDSSALDGTIGTWTGSNAAVARTTTAGQFVSGTGGLLVTPSAAGLVKAIGGAAATSKVTPGKAYCARAKIKADITARTDRLYLVWKDSGGTTLRDDQAHGVDIAVVTSGFTEGVTAPMVAPPSAAYAQIRFEYTAGGVTDRQFADELSIAPAQLLNLIEPDGTFENASVGGWTAATNGVAPAVVAGGAFGGTNSLRLEAIAAGAMTYVSKAFQVVGSMQHRVQLMAKSEVTARTLTMGVRFTSSTGVVTDVQVLSQADTAAAFTLFQSGTFAGMGATFVGTGQVYVTVAGAAAGERHRIDDVHVWQYNDVRAWGQGGLVSYLDFVSSPRYEVQYSDNGGSTWNILPWVTSTADDTKSVRTDKDQFATVVDYGANPYVTRFYRARAIADLGGGTAYSTWTQAPAGWRSITSAAWLKDPYVSTTLALRLEEITKSPKEAQSVFLPLGRPLPVTQSEGVKGDDLSITLRTETQDEHDALTTLLASGRVLVFTDTLGETWWIKILDKPSITQIKASPLLTETTPVRFLHRFSVQAVEVAPPVRSA